MGLGEALWVLLRPGILCLGLTVWVLAVIATTGWSILYSPLWVPVAVVLFVVGVSAIYHLVMAS